MPSESLLRQPCGRTFLDIDLWLRGIEPAPEHAHASPFDKVINQVSRHSILKPSKRRRRLSPSDADDGQGRSKRRVLSPPNTEPIHLAMASSHEARSDDPTSEAGADVTPRPTRFTNRVMPSQTVPSPSRTPSSRASSSRQSLSKRSASSTLSRNPSPTKQIRAADLDNDGYALANFDNASRPLPRSLQTLVGRLQDIGDGAVGFPRAWWNEELRELGIPESYFAANSDSAWCARPDTPLASLIKTVLERAAECHEHGDPESVWCEEVYARTISWVLRPVNGKRNLVDKHNRINEAFHAKKLPSKMVDYCLIFRPAAESSAAVRIKELRSSRPGQSINHSDTGSLCFYPIGLSLEFKNQEGSAAESEAQMGTWHAAQWRSLRYGCLDAIAPAIDFLPGIIIHGHAWNFVATVPPHPSTDRFLDAFGKPTLFSHIPLGSTSTRRGLCKILASLRCLVTWLEDEYWPAFQEQILEIPSTTRPPGAK